MLRRTGAGIGRTTVSEPGVNTSGVNTSRVNNSRVNNSRVGISRVNISRVGWPSATGSAARPRPAIGGLASVRRDHRVAALAGGGDRRDQQSYDAQAHLRSPFGLRCAAFAAVQGQAASTQMARPEPG